MKEGVSTARFMASLLFRAAPSARSERCLATLYDSRLLLEFLSRDSIDIPYSDIKGIELRCGDGLSFSVRHRSNETICILEAMEGIVQLEDVVDTLTSLHNAWSMHQFACSSSSQPNGLLIAALSDASVTSGILERTMTFNNGSCTVPFGSPFGGSITNSQEECTSAFSPCPLSTTNFQKEKEERPRLNASGSSLACVCEDENVRPFAISFEEFDDEEQERQAQR